MTERKRKRQNRGISPEEHEANIAINPMDVFRRHFEAQFEPIEVAKLEDDEDCRSQSTASSEDDESKLLDSHESESDGEGIQVVDASRSGTVDRLLKRNGKSFMSSKPPSIVDGHRINQPQHMPTSTSENDPTEAENIRNDLALQRLLREAHLLDGSAHGLEVTGKNRIKALELRVQSLGGKDITEQKMPMKVRKGMEAAKLKRERKRRREAKETDTVLEKPTKKIKERKTRDRGLGPGIGKFRGGALVLSKRDVREIQGEPRRVSTKSGRDMKRRKR